jgi:hypothetical protein
MKYKEIPGFSKYGISESGEVKNLETGRIRKSRILKKYVHIALFSYSGKRKGFYIHQLVAMTYLGHEPCGYDRVVDHIDNDKLNNHVSNLQIISQRENSSKDKFRYNPTSQYTGVNWHCLTLITYIVLTGSVWVIWCLVLQHVKQVKLLELTNINSDG